MKKIALNLLLLLLLLAWGWGGGVMFDTKYSRHSEDNGDCSSGVFVLLGFGGVDLLGVVDDVFWWRCRSSRSRRCRSPSVSAMMSSGGGVGLLAAVSVFLESAVMWVFILAGMVGMEEGMKDFARC